MLQLCPSLLCWGAQTWVQHSRCVPPPLTYCNTLPNQALLPILYPLQTSWGCTLFHHQEDVKPCWPQYWPWGTLWAHCLQLGSASQSSSSKSFQSTLLSIYLVYISSVCLWICYRRLCQKAYLSWNKQHPLLFLHSPRHHFLHLITESYQRLSSWLSIISSSYKHA